MRRAARAAGRPVFQATRIRRPTSRPGQSCGMVSTGQGTRGGSPSKTSDSRPRSSGRQPTITRSERRACCAMSSSGSPGSSTQSQSMPSRAQPAENCRERCAAASRAAARLSLTNAYEKARPATASGMRPVGSAKSARRAASCRRARSSATCSRVSCPGSFARWRRIDFIGMLAPLTAGDGHRFDPKLSRGGRESPARS